LKKETPAISFQASKATQKEYRRKVVYGKLRKNIGLTLRRLYDYRGIEIVEVTTCRDHLLGVYRYRRNK